MAQPPPRSRCHALGDGPLFPSLLHSRPESRSNLADRAAALRLPRGMVAAVQPGRAETQTAIAAAALPRERPAAPSVAGERGGAWAGPRGHTPSGRRGAAPTLTLVPGTAAASRPPPLVLAPVPPGNLTLSPARAVRSLGTQANAAKCRGLMLKRWDRPYKDHRGAQRVELGAPRVPRE